MTDREMKDFLTTFEQFARISRELADAKLKDAQFGDLPAVAADRTQAGQVRWLLAGAAMATAFIGGLSGLLAVAKALGWF